MARTIPRVALSTTVRLQLLDLPKVVNVDLSSAQTTIIARVWLQVRNVPLSFLCTYGEEASSACRKM